MPTPYVLQPDQIDGLWRYMKAREDIRRARLAGRPWPWTEDRILQEFKFTNVRRLHDKTTQYFLKIYEQHKGAFKVEGLLNAASFRYHGTMNWASFCGWQRVFDAGHMLKTAAGMLEVGEQVYTGAYIITNGGIAGNKEEVVVQYLAGMWEKALDITAAIEDHQRWEAGYKVLSKVPGFGGSGFMSKEVLQDYLLWRNCAGLPKLRDEDTWSPAGPGARRGLNRLCGREVRFNQPEAAFIEELRSAWFLMDEKFVHEFGEHLTMHDVQFCLCEFDKYERTRLGEGRPRSRYTPR